MTQPVSRHPGALYHIARRIHHRQFRLRPDEGLNGAFACLIQDICQRTGVDVLSICIMGNHIHLVVYDAYGRLSSFMAQLFGTSARYINVAHGLNSHVWDAQEANVQRLGDLESAARVSAYVIANPVAAGLVHSPAAWPGVCTTLNDVATGRGPTHKRPATFFRPRGPVSEEGMVSHECPPGVSPPRFRKMVQGYLGPMLEAARNAVKESGRGYAGARAVLETSPFDGPTSPTEHNAGVAAKPMRASVAATGKRVVRMVNRRQRFINRYGQAKRQMMAGTHQREVEFPAGTLTPWRQWGARREPPLKKVWVAA